VLFGIDEKLVDAEDVKTSWFSFAPGNLNQIGLRQTLELVPFFQSFYKFTIFLPEKHVSERTLKI
jgi:hypothetical protein